MTENDTTIELSSAAKNLAKKTAKVAIIGALVVVAVKFAADKLNSSDNDVQTLTD